MSPLRQVVLALLVVASSGCFRRRPVTIEARSCPPGERWDDGRCQGGHDRGHDDDGRGRGRGHDRD